jgi:hypothetical protein
MARKLRKVPGDDEGGDLDSTLRKTASKLSEQVAEQPQHPVGFVGLVGDDPEPQRPPPLCDSGSRPRRGQKAADRGEGQERPPRPRPRDGIHAKGQSGFLTEGGFGAGAVRVPRAVGAPQR